MEEMSSAEIQELAREVGLGHLCLAKDGDAYGIPLFYAFDGRRFYFHSHPGLKDEYADVTGEACLVITRAESADSWASIQVFGRISKVVRQELRLRAVDALMQVPFPPREGFMPHGEPRRDNQDLYVWTLEPGRWSGRKSSPMPG